MIGYCVCYRCKWFNKDGPGISCDAFQDGVPHEIAGGDNDHTEPFDGDNGIQFEAADEPSEHDA